MTFFSPNRFDVTHHIAAAIVIAFACRRLFARSHSVVTA